MSGFIPEARTQAHVPICNAIEAGDFKQALKLVDKRLAKTSDSYLVALKCFAQAQHTLVTERANAYLLLSALAQPGCKQCITDADELEIYDEACMFLSKDHDRSEMATIICKIRLAAVKARSSDERLALACFRACLKRCNWDYAQQIANLLEKNFPSNHKYPFWKQTTALLLAGTPECDEMRKKIYITLASRTLQTFAKATSDAQSNSMLSVKSLQKPHEILLYHRVLKASNQITELLDAYRDPKIGTASRIAKGEWVFKRSQVILLEVAEQWQELFDICHCLLEEAHADAGGKIKDERGADWTVWKAYINAAVHLQTQESHDKVRDQINAHAASTSGVNKTYKRNASMASMEFAFKLEKNGKVRDFGYPPIGHTRHMTPQAASILEYLFKYGHTASAFGDVKEYIEKLRRRDQQQLIWSCRAILKGRVPWAWVEDHVGDEVPTWTYPPAISKAEEVTSWVTWVKIMYLGSNCVPDAVASDGKKDNPEKVDSSDEYITCTWCDKERDSTRYKWCEGCHKYFIWDCMGKYSFAINGEIQLLWAPLELLPTDIHPGDDFALVAAMSLIKLGSPVYVKYFADPVGFPQRNGPKRLIQAAAFLEFAHSKSPANPQILLLLIRLYSVLGAGSLAMRAYNKLNVKQIQGDTLGYMLFDRISSLHPHPVQDNVAGSPEVLDPAAKLTKLQSIYRNFHDQITSNCWRSFEAGSYDSIFQLMEAHDKLSRSVGCAISVIELRKILRLTKPQTVFDNEGQGYDLLAPNAVMHEFSDNLDYNSFPNFEPSDAYPVARYIALGPLPTDFRIRTGLLLDELWMVLKSPFEGQTSVGTRLLQLEKSFASFNDDFPSGLLTPYETCQVSIGLRLIDIVLTSCLYNKRSNRGFTRAPYFCIVDLTKFLTNLKNVNLIDVHAPGYFPNFEKTLHPLYISYDAASMAIATEKFLHAKAIDVNEATKEDFAVVAKLGRKVQHAVVNKAKEVQKRMNEGGWIDWLVDSIVEEPEGKDVNMDPKTREYYEETPGRSLRRLLTPEFTEWFAGELVDSWKESVMGLAALTEH